MPARPALVHHRRDLGTDGEPDFRPAVSACLSQGAGMFFISETRPVRIVVELGKLFSPPDKHGVGRGKNQINRTQENLGPYFNRPNRRCAPIELAYKVSEFSGAMHQVVRAGPGQGLL